MAAPPSLFAASASPGGSSSLFGAGIRAAQARAALEAQQDHDDGFGLGDLLEAPLNAAKSVGRLAQEFGQGITGLVNAALPDEVQTPWGTFISAPEATLPLGMGKLGGTGGPGWRELGKGMVTSLAGTASTANKILPTGVIDKLLGSPIENTIEGLPEHLWGEEYRAKDFLERAKERGYLSAAVEDIGNVALIGSAVTAPARAGSAAARAAEVASRAAGAEGAALRFGESAARLGETATRLGENPIVHALQHPYRTAGSRVRSGVLAPAFERVAEFDAPTPPVRVPDTADELADLEAQPARALVGAGAGGRGPLLDEVTAPDLLDELPPEIADAVPGLAARAPGRGSRFLAGIEGRLRGRDAARVVAEQTRMADMSRARAARSDAVTDAVTVAQDLLMQKAQELGVPDITRQVASQIVGDEVYARLSGIKAMIEGEFPNATPDMLVRAGVRQTVIPEPLRSPELDAALDEVSANFEVERANATAELRSTRVGERGLDADPDAPVLTRSQERALADARRKLREATSDTTDRRIARQRAARERLRDTLNDKLGRIGEQGRLLDQQEATALRRFDHSRRWTPRAWRSPEALAETAQALYDATVADGGASFDPHAGRFVQAGRDPGFAVAVVPGTARSVPLAELTPQDFMDVARAYQDVYQHPNTVLGSWVDDDGTAHLDPTQIIGAGLTETEALIDAVVTGAVRGQEAVFDIRNSASIDVPLKDRPDVAERFITRDGRVTPHARRAYAQVIDSVVGAGMPADDAHRLMALEMTLAVSAADKGLVATPDAFFQHLRHEKAKRPSRLSRALRQEIPARSIDTRAQRARLWREVETRVQDLDHALGWYHNSHDSIEARFRNQPDITLLDGKTKINPADLMYQVLAVLSVNASPRSNITYAMDALANVHRMDGAVIREAVDGMQRFVDGRATLEEAWTGKKGALDKLLKESQRENKAAAKAIIDEHVPTTSNPYPNARQFLLEILRGTDSEGRSTLLAAPDESGTYRANWTAEYIRETNDLFGVQSTPASTADALAWAAEHGQEGAVGKLGEELFTREFNSRAGRAKLLSFWENLANPQDSLSVTLDRVMEELLGFELPTGHTANPAWFTTAEKFRQMAAELEPVMGRKVAPHEVQAAFWVFAKTEIQRVQMGHFMAWADDAQRLVHRGVQLTDDADPMLQWLAESRAPYGPDAPEGVAHRRRRIRGEKTKTEDVAIRSGGTKERAETLAMWERREQRWLGVRDAINYALAKGDQATADRVMAEYINHTTTSTPKHGGLLNDIDGGDFGDVLALEPWPSTAAAVSKLRDAGIDIGPVGSAGERYTRLEQAFQDTVLGEFVPHSDVVGGVIRVFEGANFQTLVHENGHLLRQILSPAEMRSIEGAYGIEGGEWTVAAEERFANDFLLHMSTGRAPEGLTSVFTRVRETVRQVWEALRDTFMGRRVPEESRAVFDSWLSPERTTNPAPVSESFLPTVEETGTLGQRAATAPNLPRPPANRQDFYRSGRTGQKALDDLTTIARRRKQLAATEAQVRAQIAGIEDVLLGRRTPAELARQKLIEEAARLEGRVANASDRPSIRNAPARWQPLLDAVYRIEKDVAANPGLADVFEGLPETLSAIQTRAMELGFDPTHVSDFSRDKVNRLVFDNMRLGLKPATEYVAGARRARSGVLARAGAVDRSIESLVAATVEATVEARTNGVIDWIETNAARPIEAGARIPDGWRLWEPTRTYLLTGTELSDNARRLVPTSAQESLIVPDAVIDTVHRYSKDYNHRALRAISRVTNPWRTLVLTLSPGWYVRNFAGNVLLASMDGVRLRDWVSAWHSFRAKDSLGRFHDIPFVESGGLARDAGVLADHSLIPGSGVRELMGENGRARGATQYALRHLTRANEVVDEFARAAVYHKNLNKLSMSDHAAWDAANKAMVDYQGLSNFERQVVRTVVPFYAWQKGILKVTMNQALDHAARTNLLILMGRMQEEYVADRLGLNVEDVPEQYRHLVGDRNIRSYNPFADAASLLTPEGIAQSLNPILEIGLRDGLGAPEFVGADTPMRLSPFGTAQPDVQVGDELLSLATRSPFGRIIGSDSPGQALGTALGLKPVDDALLRDRFLRARARIEGQTPAAAAAASPGGFGFTPRGG